MRTKPFNWGATPAASSVTTQPATLNKPSLEATLVRDISAELARPRVQAPAPPPTREPEKPAVDTPRAETQPAPGTEPASQQSTVTLRSDFEKFKDKMRTEGETAIKDPKRAAATTLKFLNFIRTVAYPLVMKWAVFEPQEKAALQPLLDKVFAAEQSKTTEARDKVLSELTVFERRVWDKWTGLEKHKATIAWSQQEIDFLVDVGHEKMMDMQFFRWLMGNEFILGILFIEGRRIAPVVTARMGMGFIDIPQFFI